jgi:hypothetical protein
LDGLDGDDMPNIASGRAHIPDDNR